MIEYDKKIIKKIYKILKKLNYKKFFFISKDKILYEHSNEKVFNILFIHENLINDIKSNIKINLIDDNY